MANEIKIQNPYKHNTEDPNHCLKIRIFFSFEVVDRIFYIFQKNINFNALENPITKPFEESIKIHILNGINSFFVDWSYLSYLISIV